MTFREFLYANRATICATICGGDEKLFEHVVAEVIAVSKTERGAGIVHCDPNSIIAAVALAASWPVSIGKDAGSALVITDDTDTPTKKPRLIAMQTARAKIDILNRFGGLRWTNIRCVYSGETFVAHQGDNPRIEQHEDLTFYPERRGNLVGAYVYARQSHSLPPVLELMNRFDIDQIRTTFSRELRDGDLEDLEFFAQYCMAKVVHRFCGRIALNDHTRRWLDDGSQVGARAAIQTSMASDADRGNAGSNPAGMAQAMPSANGNPPRTPVAPSMSAPVASSTAPGLPPREHRTPLAAGVL